jgi:hypothetical protein
MASALFGLFLVIHGLIHLSWVAPKPDDPSYPFRLTGPAMFRKANPRALAGVGAALVVVSTVAFVIAGVGVWGVPGFEAIWRGAAIVGSTLSLLVVATFWHRWFMAGPVLDVAIIVAAFAGWPVP